MKACVPGSQIPVDALLGAEVLHAARHLAGEGDQLLLRQRQRLPVWELYTRLRKYVADFFLFLFQKSSI